MNLRPSSSPTGRSSENGVSAQEPFTLSSFSCGMPVSLLELLERRVAARARDDRLRRPRDAVVRVEHVHRDADRAALVGERAADRVADPPRRVRREAVAARVVEALDRLHQADVALLDQVDERQPAAVVPARDRDHEAQVRLHELVLHDLRSRRGLADLLEEPLVLRGRAGCVGPCAFSTRTGFPSASSSNWTSSSSLLSRRPARRRACARLLGVGTQSRSLSARRMAASEAHSSAPSTSSPAGASACSAASCNALSSLRSSAICGSVDASSLPPAWAGPPRASRARTRPPGGTTRIATQWSISAFSTSIAVWSSSSGPITACVAISRK